MKRLSVEAYGQHQLETYQWLVEQGCSISCISSGKWS